MNNIHIGIIIAFSSIAAFFCIYALILINRVEKDRQRILGILSKHIYEHKDAIDKIDKALASIQIKDK